MSLSLPTSLRFLVVSVSKSTDFSALTCLTRLEVELVSPVSLTFPTQLRVLFVTYVKYLTESNIGDVALEVFESRPWDATLTRRDLETLPKTLRTINASFEPRSLEKELPSMFPLIGTK